MLTWKIDSEIFQLRYNWKLSRNEALEKNNFFVSVTDGTTIGIGEIAPNLRYGETSEKVSSDFDNFLKLNISKEIDPVELIAVLKKIQVSRAVSFGISSALFHYYCSKNNTSLGKLLNLPALNRRVSTSFTIPIMDTGSIEEFYRTNGLARFDSLKIKINDKNCVDVIQKLAHLTDKPLRVDANEAWTDVDSFMNFTENIKHQNIEFIEQPFPVRFVEGYKYIKNLSPFEIMGDESIVGSDLDYDKLASQFHGINMKLMKAGSYVDGFQIINTAKSYGLKTMVGCMVETTLGIAGGLIFAPIVDYIDLDGHMLIQNEPYNLVNEHEGGLKLNTTKF